MTCSLKGEDGKHLVCPSGMLCAVRYDLALQNMLSITSNHMYFKPTLILASSHLCFVVFQPVCKCVSFARTH